MIEGGHPLSGSFAPPGTRTARCRFSPRACSRTSRSRSRTSRASETSKRCWSCSRTSAPTSRARRERRPRARARRDARDGRGAREPDPCVVPARRPAARADRSSERAAAGRRRDRTPPARPAHSRVRGIGANVELGRPVRAGRHLRGAHIHLDEASVMATENAVMAATTAPGGTMISNAACEPHVQDRAGSSSRWAREIDGIGSNVLQVTGVDGSRGGELRDRARAHRGRELHRHGRRHGRRDDDRGHRPDDLWPVLPVLRRLGVEIELGDDWVQVPGNQDLASSTTSAERSQRSRTGPGRRFPPT